MVIPIEKFFKYSPKELLNGYGKNHVVRFMDNVELQTTFKEIVLYRYMAQIFEVIPTKIPLTSKFLISNYYSNGLYNTKTLNKCFEAMLVDVIRLHVKPNSDRAILDNFYRRMYEVLNQIYNEVIFDNIRYATSLSIDSFLEIQFDEKLIKSMQDVDKKKDLQSVNKTYEVLDDVMRNKKEVANNPIRKAYIAGTVNPNQVKQVLASRGYVTEIDSSIFKYPVASSFTLGMSNLYDITVESRSGAKALFLSNKAVQESEYFAREMQLIVMHIEKIIDTDCGNTEYIDWYVRSKEEAGKSDIDNMLGKVFIDPKTGKPEYITKEHTYLEGTTIKIRNAMKCKLKNSRHVCSACFGELVYGLFDHTNIGQISATTLTQKLTQSILSTKHLTSNATSGDVTLSEPAKQFFVVKSKSGIGLKPMYLNKKYKMKLLVHQFEAFGLKDMKDIKNVRTLNPQRVSRVKSINIIIENKGKEEFYPIPISEGKKHGAFTYEFLEYLIQEGFTLDDQDRFVIDLTNWTSALPIMIMPQVEFNFLALAKQIKAEFKFMKMDKYGKSKETQESLLQKMFDLINNKLDVNIALIEIIIYAFSIKSAEHRDFSIGRNVAEPELTSIANIMSNRSLGGGYAYERVLNNMIMSPRTYYGKNNINHLLDVAVMPNETVLDKYGTLNPDFRDNRIVK